MPIPRIFHQIWLGPDALPAEFARYRKTWRRHHRDWEMQLWTEDNLPADLRRPEVAQRLRVPAERSDILRLELLWRYGGVYLDTDMECRKPIDELLDGVEVFAAYLKFPTGDEPMRVTNTVLGAVAGHPLLDRALDAITPCVHYGQDVKQSAGPGLLNRLLLPDPPESVTLFDPPVFYPRTPAEEEGAHAVHHVARSWKDEAGFRRAALLAEKRQRQIQGRYEKLQRKHALTAARLAEVEDALLKRRPVMGRMALLSARLAAHLTYLGVNRRHPE